MQSSLNKSVSIDDIAKGLQVTYIVEGSVRIADNKLRVNASLRDIIKDKIILTGYL